MTRRRQSLRLWHSAGATGSAIEPHWGPASTAAQAHKDRAGRGGQRDRGKQQLCVAAVCDATREALTAGWLAFFLITIFFLMRTVCRVRPVVGSSPLTTC
jgi:hypothetical protein